MKQFSIIRAAGTNYEVGLDIPKKHPHIAHGQPTPESYVEYSLTHMLNSR